MVIDGDGDSEASASDAYIEACTPTALVTPIRRVSVESEINLIFDGQGQRSQQGFDSRDKGGFGERWVEVLAEVAGLGCAFEKVERSIGEFTFTYTRRIGVLSETKIKAQIKTTADPSLDGKGRIVYPLDAEAYNRLVGPSQNPAYLFLVATRKLRSEWVVTKEWRDELHSGVYYLSLRDEEETANASKKTVHVPLANRVTPESLNRLCVDAAYEYHAAMGMPLP